MVRLFSYIRCLVGPGPGGKRENAEGILVGIGGALEEVRNVKKTTKSNPNKMKLTKMARGQIQEMKITESCRICLTVPVKIARQQTTELNKMKPRKWSNLWSTFKSRRSVMASKVLASASRMKRSLEPC